MRYQSLLLHVIFNYLYDRLLYVWMLLEHCLDLSQFDAMAMNLYLLILPPQKLDLSVRPITGSITRPV